MEVLCVPHTNLQVSDIHCTCCRLLSQFAFHLSHDWELPGSENLEASLIRLGVRDMLVKHHLFSWNTS